MSYLRMWREINAATSEVGAFSLNTYLCNGVIDNSLSTVPVRKASRITSSLIRVATPYFIKRKKKGKILSDRLEMEYITQCGQQMVLGRIECWCSGRG
eukprot:scaffold14409_cov88-Skeletonema_dohrnii-CCMP3373.AAC.6